MRPLHITFPTEGGRLFEVPSVALSHKSIPAHPPTLSITLGLTEETMRHVIAEDFPDGLDEQQYCEVLIVADAAFEILECMPSFKGLKPIPLNDRLKEGGDVDVKGKGKEGESVKLYDVRDTGDSDMGLGMFATKGLSSGELVLAERPLMILPKKPIFFTLDLEAPKSGLNDEEKNAIKERILEDIHENILEAHLATLLPKRKAQFLALSSFFPLISERERERPLWSRVKVNGIDIPSGAVIDPVSPHNGRVVRELLREYVGVCNDLSRVNHSCTPNVAFSFDTKSWTFQLHTLHAVSPGEQLFVSYVPVLLSVEDRARSLAKLGFTCQCNACTNPTPTSITLRASFEETVGELETRYKVWLSDIQASDTQILEPALALLAQADQERLFIASPYGRLLSLIFHCYCANGDRENTKVYRVKTFTWYAARAPRERDVYKKWLDDEDGERLVDKYQIWKARIKVRRNAVAWTGRQNT